MNFIDHAETEKGRQRGSIATRKVFARPESFCALNAKMLKTVRTVWKLSGQSGNFPDSLETFRTVWKLSGQSGNFPDSPESVWTAWKMSGQSGKYPHSLENVERVWKLQDCLKTVWKVW